MDKSNHQFFRYGRSLSWEERISMINEYLTGNFTKVELWKKYTGQSEEHGQLLHWMRELGYVPNENSGQRRKKFIPSQSQVSTTLDPKKNKDPQALQKRIKELEKQLEQAQLKAEGYEIMIDIAENELKIPIRKKSDTK